MPPLNIDQKEEVPPNASVEPPPEGCEWVILHCRPRAEKKAHRTFALEGAAMFLPLRKKEHRYGGRLRTFWSPLFPGYLFGCFPFKKVNSLRSSQYVANVLRVVDQPGLVHQLQQLQRALDTGNMLEVMPYLEKGKAVRIISGSMKGVEGIVEQVDKTTRVVISIEMIQKSVFMEVEGASIEVL